MPERHLLPIPLPHGRSGQTGSLTVYFSPRLRSKGRLFHYPEWEHWVDTVNAMAINVVINGVPQVPTRVTPLANPSIWDAVFHRQTPVSGFRPTDWRSLANNSLQVGPGGDFSEAILNLYASFVTSFPDAPPAGDVAVTLPAAAVLTSPGADAAREYVAPMTDKDRARIEEPRDPEWDFHEFVSLLGHHPELLRLLGIAVELEVNLPANPVSVRVHTDYDNGADRRAVDFVMATTSDFWAKPNPDPKLTEQQAGFLRLAQQGAFLSIVDVLSSADRLRDLDKHLPGGSGALPALRTRALTLVRPDLVTAFRNRTERQWAIEEEIDDALNTGQPVPIFAEDVTIGHRVDVTGVATSSFGASDEALAEERLAAACVAGERTGVARSSFGASDEVLAEERLAAACVAGERTGVARSSFGASDEALAEERLAAACVAGERTGVARSSFGASDEALAEERLAAACVAGERNRGTVWRSLFERQTDAAGYHFPRDKKLDLDPQPDEGWTTTTLVTELVETFEEPKDDIDDPFVPQAMRRLDDQLYRWDGWSGAVRPPGSAVDGTGAIAPTQPTVPPKDSPVQFAAAYEVVLGSLPRLRFGHQYLMRARCVDLSGDSRSLATVEPKSALPPVETFGRLEPIPAPLVVRRLPRPIPGVGDDALAIVLRSDYDIDDTTVAAQERLLFPAQVGQDLCELHGQPNGGADPASYALLTTRDARDPDDPWQVDPVTGEPIAEGRRRQPVRYLSDPLVGRLRAFHHGESIEHLVPLKGTWPAVDAARLQVVAGPEPTEITPDDVTDLRIAVAKADIHTVDLSYAPAEGGVEQFGLWHQLDVADQVALRPVIENGAHWMFSPRAPVQLVHAVRRPLLAPRILEWQASREDHSTGVTFTTIVEIERRSTGRLTLDAKWIDLVDDLRVDGPESRRGGAPLGRFLTPHDVAAPPTFEITDHRAELGDTRRHAALIDLEAFSSFSAYFTEQRSGPIAGTPTVIDRRGFARATVRVIAADGTAAAEGVDYVVDHAKGAIAALPTGRFDDGDAVTVRYVPLPVSRTSAEPGIEPFEFVFLSTKAPPPPTVVEVVPAFARQRTSVGDDGDSEHVVVHDGAVLRLYLARPWNVSGDGEQLAVLIEQAPGDVPAGSCIGRDPIVTGTTTALTAESFSRRVAITASSDGVHDLAVHDVQYDPESKRWFTDIAVATSMYRPFLRLVVARYQVDSIAGRELSSPVTLDPVRLGVSRTISVRPAAATDSYDVTVSGPDHGGMAADDGTADLLANEVAVTHQQIDTAIADADLRWRIDVSTVTLQRLTSGAAGTWTGTVGVPTDGTPRRLLIEEREPALEGGQVPTTGSEVVYTDVVEFSA